MRQYSKILISLCIVVVVGCISIPADAEIGVGIKGGVLMPDQKPFKTEFDSNYVIGAVLELDSNMGLVLEADVEYYKRKSNDSKLGGEISIIPIVFSAKYNFRPRYTMTPFVGIGIGSYFFDRDYKDGTSKSKSQFGARTSAGLKFFQDRNLNIVFEAARNFVDFNSQNASSFEFTMSILLDLNSSIIGTP